MPSPSLHSTTWPTSLRSRLGRSAARGHLTAQLELPLELDLTVGAPQVEAQLAQPAEQWRQQLAGRPDRAQLPIVAGAEQPDAPEQRLDLRRITAQREQRARRHRFRRPAL